MIMALCNKKLSYHRDCTHQWSLYLSGLFNITDFDANWKPICKFPF